MNSDVVMNPGSKSYLTPGVVTNLALSLILFLLMPLLVFLGRRPRSATSAANAGEMK
jgi:hypothetical protein